MTAQKAGLLLAKLLSEPGKARRMWVQRSGIVFSETISFAAVAQVLAEYLWDTGEMPDDDRGLPRRLRDKVRRALVGQTMTWQTLNWLMNAFELADSDREALADAMEAAAEPTEHADAVQLPVRHRYRTLSVTEHHWIGPDRRPIRHLTTQVLQGNGEQMPSHTYMFDTNTIDVKVIQGARSVGPVRQIRGDIHAVDILLLRPLEAGQTTTLTYESTFSYRQPPEPEFRRAAFEGVQSLDLRVEFHPSALPREVTFAQWDQLGHHTPSHEEATPIEDDHSVHRFLDRVVSSIVGFRWRWT